ncbi:MAG TPA: SDR family oxidoreductase [Fimbriimonadaceae bacterium]|nr:SDR family oxidoreductase [Fimbriimonadaceae bacterium]
MNLGLEGRVAMVAAASKGIGFAVAQELLAEGCKVSICGRNREALDAALASLSGAIGSTCDVSQSEDIESWFAHTRDNLGDPDILVTNTGGPPAGKWMLMSDEQWQSGFDSTVMNIVRMVRLATPKMVKNKWGRIVHITSLVARQPHDLLPISSTLRSGLEALTRLQSDELARYGVTVNSVLPGHTMTARQLHLAEIRAERESMSVDEVLAEQGRAIPVGRLAEASEIADVVTFLCSERASYVTGIGVLVDGGIVRSVG